MDAKLRDLCSEKSYKQAIVIYDELFKDINCTDHIPGKADCLVLMGKLSEAIKYYKKVLLESQELKLEHFNNFALGVAEFVRKSVPKQGTKEKNAFLICAICESMLFEAVTLQCCGHSSCYQCLKSQKRKTCIACSEKFSLENKNYNVTLQAFLLKYFQKKCNSLTLRREGNAYFERKDFARALAKYEEAEIHDPSDHLLQSNLSFALSSLMRFDEALDKASLTCKLKPSWPKGYYRKGCALIGLGRNAEAAAAFIHCLARDPNNEAVKSSLMKVVRGIFTEHRESELEKLFQSMFVAFQDCIRACEEKKDAEGFELWECTTKFGEFMVEDMECTLCCRLYYEPVTTPCGHVFCRSCLNRSLDHRPYCPICRFCLDQYLAERKQVVTKALEQLLLTCYPAQYEERKKQHEEELAQLAGIAGDNQEDVPIFVCALALPTIPCPLHVFEPRYRLMMRRCIESGARQFGMCVPTVDNSFADFGCMLEIRDAEFLPDGRSLIDTIGGRRFKVLERGMKDGYYTAKVQWLTEDEVPEDQRAELNELHAAVFNQAKQWFDGLPLLVRRRITNSYKEMPAFESDLSGLTHGPRWIWWFVLILPLPTQRQLSILAMTSLKERLKALQALILLLGHT